MVRHHMKSNVLLYKYLKMWGCLPKVAILCNYLLVNTQILESRTMSFLEHVFQSKVCILVWIETSYETRHETFDMSIMIK